MVCENERGNLFNHVSSLLLVAYFFSPVMTDVLVEDKLDSSVERSENFLFHFPFSIHKNYATLHHLQWVLDVAAQSQYSKQVNDVVS